MSENVGNYLHVNLHLQSPEGLIPLPHPPPRPKKKQNKKKLKIEIKQPGSNNMED